MVQKKLEKESKYAKYDLDGDGVVDDNELSAIKEIEKAEACCQLVRGKMDLRNRRRGVRSRTRELLAKDIRIDVDAMKAEENLCIVARNLLIPS